MHTVGFIGCGYWGPNLIRNCVSLPNCLVKYICDKDEKRLSHLGNLYPNIIRTTDMHDIFSDPEIDSVFIATPVGTHFEFGMKSLNSGKHTFIEKPLACSVNECNQLISVAENNDLQLMVGHTFIFSQPVREIKKIIDSGEIGDVLYIGSRRLNLGLFQKDINVAWDLAPHDLSIIQYLLGSVPTTVNCQGMSHFANGIEDVTSMTLSFSNSCIATVQSSWLDPKKIREFTIVGSKKMIVYDDTNTLEKIRIYDKSVTAPPHYNTFGEFHYSYNYGDISIPYITQEEPLNIECRHFFDCIDGVCSPMSSGHHGRDVVAILESASSSMKNNGAPVAFCIDS